MDKNPTRKEIFDDLLRAYHRCKKGKHRSIEVLRFEARLGENLYKLSNELFNGTYRPKPLKCFVVTHPKPREIFAANFNDRLVHHLIVDPLEKIWEPKFSPSSYACRKNMGPLRALKYIQKSVRSLSQGGYKTVYGLHLDIKSFFVTIDRNILKELFLCKINDPWLYSLTDLVLSNDGRVGSYIIDEKEHQQLIPKSKTWYAQGKNVGVPIGSLTSQFGSNLYLNELDQYINRTLKPKKYIRYMDDLLLLDTDPEILKAFADPISKWLQEYRNQDLNHNKTRLLNLRTGLTYLGVVCKQTDSAKEPLQFFTTKKRKWDFIKSIHKCESSQWLDRELLHDLAFPFRYKNKKQLASINSHLGILKHSNSYLFRKEALERCLLKTSGNLNNFPPLSRRFYPLKTKRDYSVLTWNK